MQAKQADIIIDGGFTWSDFTYDLATYLQKEELLFPSACKNFDHSISIAVSKLNNPQFNKYKMAMIIL